MFILFPFLITLLLGGGCSKNVISKTRYKGKLEVAGICKNYTIRVIEGNIDTNLVVANWIDDVTNISYSNVFRLANICDFPAAIKQGDEFYFTFFTGKGENCSVCLAYYPTPSKSISIKIAD